jgi:predicted double-glycine peptidase
MARCNTILGTGLAITLFGLAIFSAPSHAQNSVAARGVEVSKNIRSLQEIRSEGVVRQRWDMSCGAAALSTVLTYDFKDYTPETAIVVWILHRVDAKRVRARGGFSLLDLKHFAEARGYHAEGYSGMSMEDLALEKTSLIVSIRLKGFDHFVVVRGIESGHVILADPGFGNLTMRADRFQKLWNSGIAFVVQPPDVRMIPEKKILKASRLVPNETVISREIAIAAPGLRLY